MRYYFDTREDEQLTRDETGVEFNSLNEARIEAALALAEIAKEIIPATQARDLAIEVRDSSDQPVMRASLHFEVARPGYP